MYSVSACVCVWGWRSAIPPLPTSRKPSNKSLRRRKAGVENYRNFKESRCWKSWLAHPISSHSSATRQERLKVLAWTQVSPHSWLMRKSNFIVPTKNLKNQDSSFLKFKNFLREAKLGIFFSIFLIRYIISEMYSIQNMPYMVFVPFIRAFFLFFFCKRNHSVSGSSLSSQRDNFT